MAAKSNIFARHPEVSICLMVTSFLLGLAFIIQLFFVSPALDNAFEDGVKDLVVMTQDKQDDNTEAYRRWTSNYYDDSPLQLFEFWLYNITNPYETAEGEDPILDIIGPWVYNRYENKTNVLFNENDNETIVSYTYHYVFDFLPERSTNISRDEMAWTISGAMLGFFNFINSFSPNVEFPPILDCVDRDIQTWPGTSAFYHAPIYDFIHGINAPYIDGLCNESDFYNSIRPNTFYRMAPSGENMVVESTGKDDIKKLRQLRAYRNNTEPYTADKPLGKTKLWMDHTELVEGGRETRQFPPFNDITKDSELIIWSIEKYRKAKYTFQKEVNWKGVDLYRFRIDDSELKNCSRYFNTSCSLQPTLEPTDPPTISGTLPPTPEPTPSPSKAPTQSDMPTMEPTEIPTAEPTENTDQPTGAPTRAPTCQHEIGESANCKYYQFWHDGLFNLTNMRGSPSLISKGRLLGSPYFIENTNRRFGIPEPDESDDQYFDIDPKSGIVFRNYHSYQFNFHFLDIERPYPTPWDNFSIIDALIPFAYVRVEGLATDDNIEEYASTLSTLDTLKGLSLYGGPVLAVVFWGLMFVILCQCWKGRGQGTVDRDDPYAPLVDDDGRYINNNDNDNATSDVTASHGAASKGNDQSGYGSVTKTATTTSVVELNQDDNHV